jgi:hypothetical protein
MSGDVVRAPARVAPWVLIVTGAGMRGAAEDRLRERATAMYGPAIPVIVHRYGVLRSGALLRWCQRVAAARLGARLRLLVEQHGRPDVVAHSFGAWLVGQALLDEPDVRLGRVLLTGSVLRPDFAWGPLIAAGRVEAVLNHYSRRDFWAWVSQFFIPGSGPSGHLGFLPCVGVINRAEAGFAHTTFFDADVIDDVSRRLWRPYLTAPALDAAVAGGADHAVDWRPVPWVLRATLPRALVGVALLAGAVGVGVALLAVGRLLL